MYTNNQIKALKHSIFEAEKKRKHYRLLHMKKDYDSIIENGNRLQFACLRLLVLTNFVKKAVEKPTKNNINLIKKYYKDYGCNIDAAFFSKRVLLLPEDYKLKEEYLKKVREILIRVKTMEIL